MDGLKRFNPEESEIIAAAKWSMTHDVSQGYKEQLVSFLKYMDFEDAAGQI